MSLANLNSDIVTGGMPVCSPSHDKARVDWMALNSIGLRSDDVCHINPFLNGLRAQTKELGLAMTAAQTEANVSFLFRPKEPDLLSRVNRLNEGDRIISVNFESDIDTMMGRSFDIATAAIFDRDSGVVLRLFDSLSERGTRRMLQAYIHLELSEMTDIAMSIQASRLAALR